MGYEECFPFSIISSQVDRITTDAQKWKKNGTGENLTKLSSKNPKLGIIVLERKGLVQAC